MGDCHAYHAPHINQRLSAASTALVFGLVSGHEAVITWALRTS